MKKQINTNSNSQNKQRQAILNFKKGLYLSNQTVEISFEEISYVISPKPAKEGFYFQIGDKKTVSSEKNILVRIKTLNILNKKENSGALVALVKDLKLIPFQTIARLTGKLGERKGQYILDPKFMHEEMVSNPGLRFKTCLKSAQEINDEVPKSLHDTEKSGVENKKEPVTSNSGNRQERFPAGDEQH